MENFRAPFLKLDYIYSTADNFRKKYSDEILPVDVLKIVEQKLRINIYPIKNLKKDTDIDALISKDFTLINLDLDHFMDDAFENRMRFSIAHELGHFVLHKELYSKFIFEDPEEWLQFINKIPEKEYSKIEFQAYEFAGRLLVPKDILLNSLIKQKRKIDIFKNNREFNVSVVVDYVSNSICRDFGVSSEVISKRILREEIDIYDL